MDPRFDGHGASTNRIHLGNQDIGTPVFPNVQQINDYRFDSVYPDPKPVNGPTVENAFVDQQFGSVELVPSDPEPNFAASNDCVGVEDEEDCDFSDAVLSYITQILMEEDMEDKTHMLQESLDLQAKEMSFYEALGKKYPPSPDPVASIINQNIETPDDCSLDNRQNFVPSCSNVNGHLIDSNWMNNSVDFCAPDVLFDPARHASNSSISSSSSVNNLVDGILDSPISSLRVPDIYNDSQSAWNFRKGVEEALKFLPNGDKLLNSIDVSGVFPQESKEKGAEELANMGKKDKDYSQGWSKGRKNLHRDDSNSDGERSSKQAAVYTESVVRSEEFDIVLLHSIGKGEEVLDGYRNYLRTATSKPVNQNGQLKGPTGRKSRARGKKSARKEVIDLRTLLISCAQAVAADDRRSANELLKQIRQHSSPFGDGNQRLAHCVADGLEARLAGTGSQIYKALINKKTSAADFLKAYHLYLASCPFNKISSFSSNKTIMIKAQNAMRVHVIDFGILYGFQWPTLIQRIIDRKDGPPKLRITGIEFPQPGFRPAERIEETGRRLADYARSFNVPFEYNAIAKKWETITLEDLKLDKDEFLVVNCLYRSKNLPDETVAAESSRTILLKLIRKINPDIFIHGIINGSYSAPFFVTRFREALFHFSSLFDMLEANVPRETPERMLIEREIFGREALNVIACEGWERVERPETYKQWHVRHLRAGFTQIPFEREIKNKSFWKVTSHYHKDFLIDEDGQWLLLGWKGRIIYALSCWKPV